MSIPLALLLFCCIPFYFFTQASYDAIETASLWVRTYFGAFYLYLGLICVLLLIAIAISRWGNYKLGKPDDKPVFNRLAWISMLYSAGMGAGILLRAVQEPVYMFLNPPLQIDASAEIISLEFTFYQWGFTAWAFYTIFALAIGYAIFKRKLPVATSSSFARLFKNKNSKVSTAFFNGVDVLTILTTVFGLVAAVGLGASQIKGGLNHLLGYKLEYTVIIILVIIICILALLSALSGVEKGIKNLSTWNIYLTVALLLFVLLQSDIFTIFEQFFAAFYRYIVDFVPMSIAYGNYDPGQAFLTDWTYYYWAFWLAWAPFTGIFIARISQGRTLREIIIGVLLIPSLGTFFWFSTFGTSAFQLIQEWGGYNQEFDNVFTSIFKFLEHYPLQFVVNSVVILLLVSFLVTSVDSAIYVLSMFTDKRPEPGKLHRTLWGIILMIFSVAIVLLGQARADSDVLTAMQKLLIITSLPLSLLMVLMILLWFIDLWFWRRDTQERERSSRE
ncbi:BCCT family transporter [Flavimarina sp. Hel_I_48]|uniref:BCCT family transporter n=1 Tax=Flavimarina sp. Hel_I_48 TaxID=1392488 RepID=UPI000AA77C34|nr:BCCT family transporter [Flavimarina sp. Hel_I_48]